MAEPFRTRHNTMAATTEERVGCHFQGWQTKIKTIMPANCTSGGGEFGGPPSPRGEHYDRNNNKTCLPTVQTEEENLVALHPHEGSITTYTNEYFISKSGKTIQCGEFYYILFQEEQQQSKRGSGKERPRARV